MMEAGYPKASWPQEITRHIQKFFQFHWRSCLKPLPAVPSVATDKRGGESADVSDSYEALSVLTVACIPSGSHI